MPRPRRAWSTRWPSSARAARPRHAADGRLRDLAGRRAARGGRLGRGLRLLVHAEVPGGAARDVAGGGIGAGDGAAALAPHAGAVLVRPAAARALLGRAAGGYHHTAPILGIYALHEALAGCCARGSRRAGSGTPRRRAPAGELEARGWSCSPTPSTGWRRSRRCGCPRGRRQGGAGPDAPRARHRDRRRARTGRPAMWRIGLMGRNASVETADRVSALDAVLAEEGLGPAGASADYPPFNAAVGGRSQWRSGPSRRASTRLRGSHRRRRRRAVLHLHPHGLDCAERREEAGSTTSTRPTSSSERRLRLVARGIPS